jgi:uncharacterized membrane protein
MRVITHPEHGQNVNPVERAISIALGLWLSAKGLRRRGSVMGSLLTVSGAEMLRRGATGRCYLYNALGKSTAALGQGSKTTSVPYPLGIAVEEEREIARPRDEVYRFWRNFENLPRFMNHLQSVDVLDDRRSHWVVKGPAGRMVEWDAEIINDVENELIAWRSIGGDVQNAGSVHFKAAGPNATMVRVKLQYNPPAGVVGALFAKLFGEEPSQQIREDLGRLQSALEVAA